MNLLHSILGSDSAAAVTAKAGTVGAVSAAPAVGVTLPVIVQVLTVAFLVLQIAYLAWKWRRDAKAAE